MPNNRIRLLVADVTGHGPAPAFVTAVLATTLRGLGGTAFHDSIPAGLEVVNNELYRLSKGDYLVTMTVLELDGDTGIVDAYFGGGLPILSLLPDGQLTTLHTPGSPLGGEHLDLGYHQITMQKGQRLFVLTDGIPEAPANDGRLLGMRRLATFLEKTRDLSAQEATASIVKGVDAVRSGNPQEDDFTFVVLDWRKKVSKLSPVRSVA